MEPIQFTEDGQVKLPHPDEISKKEKDDAMGAYLMMFAVLAAGLPLPLLNLIAAIIYYFINKKESRFVAFHAYQSLITQVIVSLLNASLIFWAIRNIFIYFQFNINKFNEYFFVYLFIVALWNILYTIYSIIACIQASKGKYFYMLFFGRLAFAKYYGKSAQDKKNNMTANKPPVGF